MGLRSLITLGVLALAWAAEQVLLPGIDRAALDRLFETAGRARDTSTFSVVALGLSPMISAFLLVEVVALLVPRWRRVRVGGPEDRAVLRRAGLVLTVILAAGQSWSMARFLHKTSWQFPGDLLMGEDGFGSYALVMLSLVGGTFFLLTLAELVDSHGLGCGVSCLLAAAGVRQLAALGPDVVSRLENHILDGGDVAKQALLVTALIAITWWILTAHARVEPWRAPALTSLRGPASGILPLTFAAALMGLPGQLFALGVDLGPLRELSSGGQPFSFVHGGLVLVGGLLLSRLFYRRRRLMPVLARLAAASGMVVQTPDLLRRLLRESLFRTLMFLLVVTAIAGAIAGNPRWVWPEPVLAITVTAVALDLVAEWRARRKHGRLVAIWPLHQVALVQPVIDALARADIYGFPRAACHRALLQFFGPHIPVVMLVPEAKAPEARAMVEAILLGAPEAKPIV